MAFSSNFLNVKISRKSHVIWDWNGTVLDDADLCVEIVNEILLSQNLNTISTRSYREQFEFPVRIYYDRLGLPSNGPLFERFSQKFIKEYRKRWKKFRLQKDVIKTISFLYSSVIKQSILSAGKQEHVDSFVDHHELSVFFTLVSGTKDIYAEGKLETGKQHLIKLNVSPDDCLLIGDTTHDYEVAADLGIDCLLFTGGHHSAERLQATGAPVINSLSKVNSWLIG